MEGYEPINDKPTLLELLDDKYYKPNKKVRLRIVREYIKSLEKKYNMDIEILNLKLNDAKKEYNKIIDQQKEIQKEVDLESFIYNSLLAFSNKIIQANSSSVRDEIVNKDKEYIEMKEKLKEAHELLVEMEDKYDKSLLTVKELEEKIESKDSELNKLKEELKENKETYESVRFQLIETIGRRDAEINEIKEENKKYNELIKWTQNCVSEINNKIDNLIFIPKEEVEEYIELAQKIVNKSE